MRAIFAGIKEQHALGNAVVLATLIATDGSTYRRPGARMMITEDGHFQGLVSGGCLEADLVLHAKKVFFDQRSRVVEYDMRAEEEGAWGLALGCNGMVRIHLQYMPPRDSEYPLLNVCQYADQDHQPVLLLSEFSEKCEGPAPTLIHVDGQLVDEYSDGQIRQEDLGPEWLGIKTDRSLQSRLFTSGRGVLYLAEWVKPQFHLLVLGAGPDAGPVCSIARLSGWNTTLVDHRVAYVNKAQRLEANRVVKVEPGNLSEAIDLRSVDAALLMSHNLNADTAYFGALMSTSIPYIGMLGPKERSEIIFQRQTEKAWGGSSEDFMRSVYAPVGLDIGGEGPEAIALSIVAEIQARINKHSAMSLRDKSGGIHE